MGSAGCAMCNVQELVLLEPRAAVAAAALDEACQVKQVIKQREQRWAAWASVCDSGMSWRAGRGAFQGRGTVKTIDTGKTRGHLTIALALLVLVTRFQAGFATRECSYSLPSLRFERVARGSTRGVSLSTSCPDMTEQRQAARPGHVCGGRIRQMGEQVDRWTGGRVDGWPDRRNGWVAWRHSGRRCCC
jgi:hypothetical protein